MSPFTGPFWRQFWLDVVQMLPCGFHSGIETVRTVVGPDVRGVTVVHTRSTYAVGTP